MKMECEYVLKLTKKEALALSIVLGARSRDYDRKLGLTEDESTLMSHLYDLLPDPDDE